MTALTARLAAVILRAACLARQEGGNVQLSTERNPYMLQLLGQGFVPLSLLAKAAGVDYYALRRMALRGSITARKAGGRWWASVASVAEAYGLDAGGLCLRLRPVMLRYMDDGAWEALRLVEGE